MAAKRDTKGTAGPSSLADERPAESTAPASSAPPTITPRTPGVGGAGVPARRRRRGPDRTTIVLFLLPALVLFVLLVLAPIGIAAYASVFNWNGYNAPTDFIGLDNFTRMFTDDVFLGDLWHGLVLIVLGLAVQLPIALGLALLVNQRFPGRGLFRLLFFAPYVLSEAVTAVLFRIVFSPREGLANRILDWVGLERLDLTYFANPDTVLFWVFLVVTWKYFGFHLIILLAGRQDIPEELVEAAATDGASGWQTFRRITFPLLGPAIRISVFLSVIGTLQLFDMVWVLTRGGPVHASETMAITMFHHGFQRFEVGYASGISVVMFVFSLVFALGYQRFVMRRDVEGAITRMRDQR